MIFNRTYSYKQFQPTTNCIDKMDSYIKSKYVCLFPAYIITSEMNVAIYKLDGKNTKIYETKQVLHNSFIKNTIYKMKLQVRMSINKAVYMS